MDWFYLQPFSLLALTQSIIAFFIMLYLLSVKKKSSATWMLALAIGAFGLFWGIKFIDYSESGLSPLPISLNPLDGMMIGICFFGFFHFAYAFLGNPYPRESKIALGLTLSFISIHMFLGFHQAITQLDSSNIMEFILTIGYLLMICWATAVFLRKRHILLNASGERPNWLVSTGEGEAQALRAFALLTFCIMLLTLPGFLTGANSSPLWVAYVEYLGQVTLLIAFVVVYINHAAEPTTFLLKLTGLSLTTILVVLGLASMMLFPNAELVLYKTTGSPHAYNTPIPELKSMRFTPNAHGGYSTVFIPRSYDPDIGDNLEIGVEGDSLVELDFSFPFYDTSWDEIYIDSNGLITFGGAYRSTSFQSFFDDALPKIAPYYRALVPLSSEGSGVFYKSEVDRATVTWYRVRERYDAVADNENTFQLVLHRSGDIDFIYDRMEALPLNGYRGLRPGGSNVKLEESQFSLSSSESITNAILPEAMTIRFEPVMEGEYRISQLPGQFDPELGENLQLRNRDDSTVSVGFPFHFFGISHDKIIINDNGIVSFGRSLYLPDGSWFDPFLQSYSEIPIIAPFFADLIPGGTGGVYFKQYKESFTVTWKRLPVLGRLARNTIQLVLHNNGTIDFTYKAIGPASFAVDLWGLYPGDGRSPIDAVRYLTAVHSSAGKSGGGLFEDFYRSWGLASLQYRHERMLPFFYVIIGSTVFILLVFPFLFLISLVWPLNALLKGVRLVDAGDLNTNVPVRINDEIGVLAQNFNRMTTSLRTAEEQLTAYAEGLEGKVAERTADLQDALRSLTETQDRLIHAEKMASLGQLTAGIAHEIKNPLNFVNNFAGLSVKLADELMETLAEGESVEDVVEVLKENAGRIEAHGKRAVDIVQKMMQHASAQSDHREITDINHLVSMSVDLAYHGMKSQFTGFEVQIHRELGTDVGELEVMPQGLNRVVLNLLSNAFDAVHEQAAATDADYVASVTVFTARKKDRVEIRISDNGTGIPLKNHEKIFEPFFTTKPTGTGIGFGLSLSYDIITQGHGGTLTMESEEGKKTTFSITLPVSA
ncbi:MAG: sensor histidine kinase [Calditrichia bacterium]